MSTTIQTVIVVLLVVAIVALGIRRLWRIFRGETPSCNCGFGPGECPLAKNLPEQLPPCAGCDGLKIGDEESGDGDGGKEPTNQ